VRSTRAPDSHFPNRTYIHLGSIPYRTLFPTSVVAILTCRPLTASASPRRTGPRCWSNDESTLMSATNGHTQGHLLEENERVAISRWLLTTANDALACELLNVLRDDIGRRANADDGGGERRPDKQANGSTEKPPTNTSNMPDISLCLWILGTAGDAAGQDLKGVVARHIGSVKERNT
jgi:hypothetical protein